MFNHVSFCNINAVAFLLKRFNQSRGILYCEYIDELCKEYKGLLNEEDEHMTSDKFVTSEARLTEAVLECYTAFVAEQTYDTDAHEAALGLSECAVTTLFHIDNNGKLVNRIQKYVKEYDSEREFGSEKRKANFLSYIHFCVKYEYFKNFLPSTANERDYFNAVKAFDKIPELKDRVESIEQCSDDELELVCDKMRKDGGGDYKTLNAQKLRNKIANYNTDHKIGTIDTMDDDEKPNKNEPSAPSIGGSIEDTYIISHIFKDLVRALESETINHTKRAYAAVFFLHKLIDYDIRKEKKCQYVKDLAKSDKGKGQLSKIAFKQAKLHNKTAYTNLINNVYPEDLREICDKVLKKCLESEELPTLEQISINMLDLRDSSALNRASIKVIERLPIETKHLIYETFIYKKILSGQGLDR